MKTLKKISFLFTAIVFSITEISAQELPLAMEEKIRAEIKSLHRQEQKAFVDGNCEKVISFYNKDVTFYTNGKKITSLNTIRDFCNRVPRPFIKPEDQKPSIDEQTFILSRSAAYTVKIINQKVGEENNSQLKKEVVTKVWAKTGEEWKIVHFHSSIDTVPPQ